MRVTVLGNAGDYLAPGSRGSGYLVEGDGGERVLLDCGGGIADALLDLRLDALVLSHFHHDHVLDLMRIKDGLPKGMPILLPPGERTRLDDLARAFAFRGPLTPPGPVLEATGAHRVGGLELRFARTEHSAPSVATRIGGFVYASDTTACASLLDLARGCDALVMHTLLPTVDAESSHAKRHATAETAGRLAAEAGARRLILSHRYHESRDADMLARAGASHPRVELAQTRDVLHI
jgi:ribonuclease BN (tRNA processing enzyme)